GTLLVDFDGSFSTNYNGASSGHLRIGDTRSVSINSALNDGRVEIGSGATVSVVTAFNNNPSGVVTLAGGGIAGSVWSNSGLISGFGVIGTDFENAGTVEANGGTLDVLAQNIGGNGSFNVASTGTLQISGASLSGVTYV